MFYRSARTELQQLQNIGHTVYRIGEITADKRLRCIRSDASEYVPDGAGYAHF